MVGVDVKDNVINDVIAEMYKRTNCLISLFGFCDFEVKYRLFKSHVMTLYGSALWDYSHRSFIRFNTAWRNCIRKLFRLPFRTHCILLPSICRDEQSDIQVFKRFARFFKSCMNSESKRVSISVELTLLGGTSASRNLMKVCDLFGCTIDNLPVKKETFEEMEPTGPVIRDLLRMRDRRDFSILQKTEIEQLINVLCTE